MSSSEGMAAQADRPVSRDRKRDKRRLKSTGTPGVYKRVDGNGKTVGYVAVIEVAGKQRKRNARTYDEARRIKRGSETDRDRGELELRRTTIAFLRYVDEWVERYRGQGRRGFRDHTRDEYRRLIRAYAHPYFGPDPLSWTLDRWGAKLPRKESKCHEPDRPTHRSFVRRRSVSPRPQATRSAKSPKTSASPTRHCATG